MSAAAQPVEPPFDPADPACWLERGRTPAHADAIARAWRDFPDLPAQAPVEARMARGRERIAARRVATDASGAETRAQREATNFAFTQAQVEQGRGDDRDIALLQGRDDYGYVWDCACRYADGWYAAHAGWPHHYPDGIPSDVPLGERRAAYDRGFTDGGGDRTDLFDAARRAFTADLRRHNLPPAPIATVTGRPLPGSWPKPSDEPRPARWSRRLVVLSANDIGGDPAWDFLDLIHAHPGSEAATIVVLTEGGFVAADRLDSGVHIHADREHLHRQLTGLVGERDYDDVLVTLQGHDLDLLDGIAGALPLTRTMERTRNTRLQQRSHLRIWLARGRCDHETMAAGHIRWGKAITGLTGRLGEFTARHVGPAPHKGHLIRVTTGDLTATGYAAPDGTPLAPEITVSSKAKLRPAIASTLRTFAAATPLMAQAVRRAA